jgi:hypothetical protein
MGHLILPRQQTLILRLVLVLGTLFAIYLFAPGAESVPVVPASDVLTGESEQKMNQAGIYVLDYNPPYQPGVSLARAADYLDDEAGVSALRGAVIMINTAPAGLNNTGFPRGTVAESLAWAIVVDTSGSTVPELFVPDTYSVAFVDADGGGLLGVLTQ